MIDVLADDDAFDEPSAVTERAASTGAPVAALRNVIDKADAVDTELEPSDDLALAMAFVYNGFRRTGLLVNHIVVGGQRKDAIIWSRKLANPADE